MGRHKQYDNEWDDDSDDDWNADSDDESSSWNDDDEESSTEPCPFCRREIHEDAERCPYCERYLSDEDPDGRAPDKPLWFVIGFLLCLVVLFYWLMGLG